MRRLLFLLVGLLLAAAARAGDPPRPATAEEVALFQAAIKNSSPDTEHWAYTEATTRQGSMAGARGETMVRFDPSQPYADQFTPLQVDGKPPTEKHLKDFRRRGEKRGERVARAAEAAKNPAYVAPPQPIHIGGTNVIPDLEHPLVAAVEEDRVIFEVPVSSPRKDIPVDKFQVLVMVNRETRLIERVAFHLRESFRVKLIAKVKAGEASMDFTVVDPKFGPVVTSLRGDGSGSLLLIPVSGTYVRTRTDWKRVKSYDERLQVKIGPLQLLDF